MLIPIVIVVVTIFIVVTTVINIRVVVLCTFETGLNDGVWVISCTELTFHVANPLCKLLAVTNVFFLFLSEKIIITTTIFYHSSC